MEDNEILEGVKEAVVEALGLEPDEVKANSSLFDDLGAESFDLLDIVFRIEKTFGIKIPRGGIQPDVLSEEGIKKEDVVVDGLLTAFGAEKLRERMKDVDGDKIHALGELRIMQPNVPRLSGAHWNFHGLFDALDVSRQLSG